MELGRSVTFTQIPKSCFVYSEAFQITHSVLLRFYHAVLPVSAAWDWIFLCSNIPSVLVKRTCFFSHTKRPLTPHAFSVQRVSVYSFPLTHTGDKKHGENFEEAPLPEKHTEMRHTQTLITITLQREWCILEQDYSRTSDQCSKGLQHEINGTLKWHKSIMLLIYQIKSSIMRHWVWNNYKGTDCNIKPITFFRLLPVLDFYWNLGQLL